MNTEKMSNKNGEELLRNPGGNLADGSLQNH